MDRMIVDPSIAASGPLCRPSNKEFLIAGELALDGRVRKINRGLSLALLAREEGYRGVILPFENAREAAVVEGVDV